MSTTTTITALPAAGRRRLGPAVVLAVTVGLLGTLHVPVHATATAPTGATMRAPVLDAGFGVGGVVTLGLPGPDRVVGLRPTGPEQLLVVATTGDASFVVLLDGAGRRVPGGTRRLPVDDVVDVERGPAATTYVLGSSRRSSASGVVTEVVHAVVRLAPDGRPDPTFGREGVVVVDDVTAVPIMPSHLAVGPRGGAVVAAHTGAASYYGGVITPVLVRFRPDGRLDTGFGARGVRPLAPSDPITVVSAIALDARGRILVADDGATRSLARRVPTVHRLLVDGRPDPSFGTAGAAVLQIPGEWARIDDVAVDETGRVVVHGDTTNWLLRAPSAPSVEGWPPFVARLRSDGSADPTFGRRGVNVLERDAAGRMLLWSGGVVAQAGATWVTSHLADGRRSQSVVVVLDGNGGMGPPVPDPPGDNYHLIVVWRGRVLAGGLDHWSEGNGRIVAYRTG